MTEPDVQRLVRGWRSRLAAVSGDLGRVATVLEPNAEAMWNAMAGWPPGRGFDGDGRGGSVSWCEAHGRERCECGGGTSFAPASDRTGDAALRPDRAAQDRDRVDELLGSLRRESFELAAIFARYGRHVATDAERRATLRDGERAVSAFGCWSHARVRDSLGAPVFVAAARGRVALGDGESRALCEWCRSKLREWGELPSVKEVEQNCRGIRVRRPV